MEVLHCNYEGSYIAAMYTACMYLQIAIHRSSMHLHSYVYETSMYTVQQHT